MPYATGETPAIGDYVRNKFEQPGTVLEIFSPHVYVSDEESVSVRWDDGGCDSAMIPATDFSLISRRG